MAQDNWQYIQLPDGSYGQFPADMPDEQIRGLIQKNYPDAFKSREPGLLERARGAAGYVGGVVGESLAPPSMRETGRAVGETVGEFLTPQSYPELAAMGATSLVGGPLAPAAVKTAGPIMRLLARIGAPTTASMGTAAVTGDDVTMSGLSTAAGIGAAEGLGLGARGVQRVRRLLATRTGIRRQATEDTARLLSAVKQEVPALQGVSSNLVTLRSRGQKALSEAFEATDQQIANAFGPGSITMPIIGRTRKGYPMNVTAPVSAKEAAQQVKLAKREAAKAPTDASGYAARQHAEQVEQTYRAALGAKDPKLLAAYDQAVMDYNKGQRVLELLRQKDVVGADEAGTFVNAIELARGMLSDVETFTPDKFPRLWRVVSRGGNIGATDVLTRGGMRVYIPSTNISTQLPIGTQYRRAGEVAPGIAHPGRLQPIANLFGIRTGAELVNEPW